MKLRYAAALLRSHASSVTFGEGPETNGPVEGRAEQAEERRPAFEGK